MFISIEMFLKLFVLFTCLSYSLQHPQLGIEVDQNACQDDNATPTIYSWHVHVPFFGRDPYDTAKANKLRSKFMQVFKDKLAADECESTFNNPDLCMFSINEVPTAPFYTHEFGVFFSNDLFYSVATWFMQNRGEYEIFLHPNTGCQIKDHSVWALWSGNPFPIDFNIFIKNDPFPWSD